MAKESKYIILHDEALDLHGQGLSKADIARILHDKYKDAIDSNPSALRTYITQYLLEQDRLQKKKDEHPALAEHCENEGLPLDDVRMYWHKGKVFSVLVNGKGKEFDEIRSRLIGDMAEHSPNYKSYKRTKHKEPVMLVIDPADPHFGKYSSKIETGEEYNLGIAVQRFSEGVEGLLNRAAGDKIEKIVLIGGNDALHIDNPHNTTTSGTRQDTSGMWFEMFNSAKMAYVDAIEKMLTIADVHFVPALSNHDYQSGLFLADCISTWFRNSKNFTSDVSPAHRKYFQYGVNLVGVTHGDGAKEADLPDLMKTEAKQAWAKSKFAYWYCHHIHHKQKKARLGSKSVMLERDKIGVTVMHTNTGIDQTYNDHTHVEYLRSISSTDSWHHRNGYQHSLKAMEGFIHCPNDGQVARYTHLF